MGKSIHDSDCSCLLHNFTFLSLDLEHEMTSGLKYLSNFFTISDHLKKLDSVRVQRAALEVECLMDCIILNTTEFTDEFMQRKLSELTCK